MGPLSGRSGKRVLGYTSLAAPNVIPHDCPGRRRRGAHRRAPYVLLGNGCSGFQRIAARQWAKEGEAAVRRRLPNSPGTGVAACWKAKPMPRQQQEVSSPLGVLPHLLQFSLPFRTPRYGNHGMQLFEIHFLLQHCAGRIYASLLGCDNRHTCRHGFSSSTDHKLVQVIWKGYRAGDARRMTGIPQRYAPMPPSIPALALGNALAAGDALKASLVSTGALRRFGLLILIFCFLHHSALC